MVALSVSVFAALSLALGPLHGEVQAGSGEEPRPMPNIVLIYADDLGCADLAAYPHATSDIPTPHSDGLARRGLIFTDAHSASAVCTPSRYSLLTGRYCWRTWLKAWVVQEPMPLLLDPARENVASRLQRGGYRTAVIGKWHLGWGDQLGGYLEGHRRPGPLECGFDEAFVVPFSHNSSPSMRVFDDGRQVTGPSDVASAGAVKTRELADTAAHLSHEAVAFIERNRERPFFLYYATTNVHFPVTPHARFRGTSERGAYGDFVVEFDWAVGEIVRALHEYGIAENTLLVVTSDNGSIETASNPYFRGKKCSIFEGGHRVPLIVSLPGVFDGGRVITAPVCQTDLFPTLADLSGLKLEERVAPDGVSLVPLLEGDEGFQRPPMIHHGLLGEFAIRDGRWKLIDRSGDAQADWNKMHRLAKGQPERLSDGGFAPVTYGLDLATASERGEAGLLFDMEQDPREQTNLWEREPAVVKRLLNELAAQRAMDH